MISAANSAIFSGGADVTSPLAAGCKSTIFAGGTSMGFGAAFFAARIGGALFGLSSRVFVARSALAFGDCSISCKGSRLRRNRSRLPRLDARPNQAI